MAACSVCSKEMAIRRWLPHPCQKCGNGVIGDMRCENADHGDWKYRCGECGWSEDD